MEIDKARIVNRDEGKEPQKGPRVYEIAENGRITHDAQCNEEQKTIQRIWKKQNMTVLKWNMEIQGENGKLPKSPRK